MGVYNPPGTNAPDIVTIASGHVFVAQTPEAFTYDDDGNLLSMELGSVHRTYAYDKLNRRTDTYDENNNDVHVGYDEIGNVTSSRDADGNTTSYTYDRLNRVHLSTNDLTATTETDYDGAGNLVRVVDPAGNITLYTYDLANRRLTDTNSAGTRHYTYDADGNVTSFTDRDGRTITYTVDGAGRRVVETWVGAASDGSDEVITYTYDLAGRLTSETDGAWTDTYSYTSDVRNLETSQTVIGPAAYGTTTINYTLNNLGATTTNSLTWNNGSPLVNDTYTYDPIDNRLTSISQAGSFVTSKEVDFTYATDGFRVASVDMYDNGGSGNVLAVSTQITYNNRNLIEGITDTGAGNQTIEDYFYTYDANGFISSRSNVDGSASFNYDKANQTTSVVYSDSAFGNEQYTYNTAGNVTLSSRRGNEKYGPNNELISDDASTYTYDAEGNLTKVTSIQFSTATQYVWDYRNRLIEVDFLDAQGHATRAIRYEYDASDHRVAIYDGGPVAGVSNTVYFVYDHDNVILELKDPDGPAGPLATAPSMAYLYGLQADQILAQDDGHDGMLWLLDDGHGTIRDLVTGAGVLDDHLKIDSFGNLIARSSSEALQTRYLLDGREFDSDTQLYYFRSRYYDPAAGRFLSPDSTGFKGGDSNLYRFVNNNPANLHDPRGTEFTQDDAINTQALSDSLSTWLTPEGINYATSYWTGGAATSTSQNVVQAGVGFLAHGAYAAFDFTILTAVDAYEGAAHSVFGGDYVPGGSVGSFFYSAGFESGYRGQSGGTAFVQTVLGFTGQMAMGLLEAPFQFLNSFAHTALTGTDYYQLGASAFDAFTAVDGVKGSVKGLLESKVWGIASDAIGVFEKNANALRGLKYLTGDGAAADLSLGLGEYAAAARASISGALKLAWRETLNSLPRLDELKSARSTDGSYASALGKMLRREANELMTRQRLQQALRAEARAASEGQFNDRRVKSGMIKDWKTGKTGDLTLYRTALETMNEIYGVPEIARSAVRNLGQDISSRVTYYDPRTGTMESGYIHRDNIQRVLDYAERNRLPEPTIETSIMDFNRMGQKEYNRILVSDGRLIWARDGTPVVTSKAAECIVVMDGSGRLYGVQEIDRVTRVGAKAVHASLIGVEEGVIFAGTIQTFADGRLQYITDNSGHFGAATEPRTYSKPDLTPTDKVRLPTLKQGGSIDLALTILERRGLEIPDDPVRFNTGSKDRPKYFVPKEYLGQFEKGSRELNGGAMRGIKLKEFDFDPKAGTGSQLTYGIAWRRSNVVPGEFPLSFQVRSLLSTEITPFGRVPLEISGFIGRISNPGYEGARPMPANIGDFSMTTNQGSWNLGLQDISSGVVRIGAFVPQQILQHFSYDGHGSMPWTGNFFLETQRGSFAPPTLSGMPRGASGLFDTAVAGQSSFSPAPNTGTPTTPTAPVPVASTGPSLTAAPSAASSAVVPATGPTTTIASSTSPSQPTSTPTVAGSLVADAELLWSQVIGRPVNLDLTLVAADLPAGQLGYGVITAVGADGRPTAGQIVYDRSGDGQGWFVDSTPGDNSEYLASNSGGLTAASNSAAAGHYDLMTLVMHEMGHLLGFTSDYSGFAAGVTTTASGSLEFDSGGILAAMASDGDHLNASVYPNALMNGYLAPGVRKLPSALEGSMIAEAWNLAAQQEASGLGAPSFDTAAGQLGFVELAGAVQQGLTNPPVSVVNGDFSSVTGTGAPSGWNVFGSVFDVGGTSILSSVAGRLYTDLSQTFIMPGAASQLQFTLTSAQLQQPAGHPGDAFEMALLNAVTTQPLLGAAFNGTDALISLQANGRLYLAPQVSIKGQPGFVSGSVVDTTQPITFTVDLSGAPANASAALFFDLVSLNGAGSRASVANVQLSVNAPNNQPPVAGNDAATTNANSPVLINVLANDSDPDGTIDPTSLVIVGAPQHGQLAVDPTTGFLQFTPAFNFIGTDTFTYRVRDNQGALSNVATVTITVLAVPLAPVAVDDTYTVPQGSPLTSNVLGNDISPNGLPITAVLAQGPAHGSLVFNADGSFTYTPAALYVGSDSFTYRDTDGTLTSGLGTVRITVTHVNHAPVAVDDTAVAIAGQPVVIPVTRNDINVDGDSLLPVIVTKPAVGTATVDAATGSIIYTAPVGFSGVVTLTYRDLNTTLQSAIATVTITVLPAAQLPGAVDDAYTVLQGHAFSGNVLLNDTPPAGTPITAVLAQGPAHGTLVFNADGSFTYTPAATFLGSDTFTYFDTDGTRASTPATVRITVAPATHAPVAVNDSASVTEGQTVVVPVTANDINVDGDNLLPVIVTKPTVGTAVVDPTTGSILYTAPLGFSGVVTFTYRDVNTTHTSAPATVTITVNPRNLPPVAVDDSYTLDQRTSVSGNVTLNDYDPNGDPIHVALVKGPTGGTLQLNSNGSFIYTPTGDYYGTDTFTYVVDDGNAVGNTATVTLVIRYVNRPPIATSGTITVNPLFPFTGNLTNFAYDPDGNPLTVRLVNDPRYGQILVNSDGVFTYQGSLLNPGTDSFTYQVSDGQYYSAPETITIDFTRREGYGYYIRDFWDLTAPGTGDAVSETLQVKPAPTEKAPELISFAPSETSGGVEGVYLTLGRSIVVPLSGAAADATTVTILSVRPVASDQSQPVSLVSASLEGSKLVLAFNSALPPGAYDLVVRLTRADGSTIDLQIAVLTNIPPTS